MTAILSFFIENGNKLVIVADRQVTYGRELREEDKFFHKGRFYIFCSGSKDVYSQVMSEIENNRTNTGHLANFINSRNTNIIQNVRRPIDIYGDNCSYLIVNSNDLDVRVMKRGTVNTAGSFEIIGAGEDYTEDVFNRFSPQGTQIRNRAWNILLQRKIIESFIYLASRQPIIGHPAIFGLDILIFQRAANIQQYKISLSIDVENPRLYHISTV